MAPPTSSPAAVERFESLADRLADDGVTEKSIFGKRGLTAGKTSLGCLFGDGLAVRLGAGTAEHSDAAGIDGAEPFDPSGRDRPFKDWVVLPLAAADRWEEFALAALRRAG
jgi:hypothetical protein